MVPINTDDVKQWLRRYSEAARVAENTAERLSLLRMKSEAPASQKLDGMPHSAGYVGDSIGLTVARLDRLEHKLSEQTAAAEAVETQLEEAFSRLSGRAAADQRTILEARYIDFLNWQEVTGLLFGGEDDFLLKQDSYLRRIHLLHKSGLIALASIIPSMEDEQNL